jgi:transposase
VTIRMGYGFRNIDNLIALVRLKCGDYEVNLPGRKDPH